jgi:hypothetical protein
MISRPVTDSLVAVVGGDLVRVLFCWLVFLVGFLEFSQCAHELILSSLPISRNRLGFGLQEMDSPSIFLHNIN